MYSYSMDQWMFLFFFYCFFGWCFESTYVSIRQKKLVNRGFLRGPLLPLYGGGAIVMLFSSYPVRNNLFLVFLFGLISATILEYLVGTVMEAIFKVKYWDYSDQKLQFQGKICLSSSLAWGGLTIFLTKLLHPFVEKMMFAIPTFVLSPFMNGIAVITIIDFTLSVRAALDIRDALIMLSKTKKELELMKKRMDVLIAFAGDNAKKEIEERKAVFTAVLEEKKEALSTAVEEKKESLTAALEERFAGLKELSISENVKKELNELRDRFLVLKSDKEHFSKLRGFYQKYLFKNNPYMKSKKFAEAFEQLRISANEKKESRKTKKNR